MMMNDSAPTHQQKKLLKTCKIVLPRKQTVCEKTYSEKEDEVGKWSHTLKILPCPQIKGESQE